MVALWLPNAASESLEKKKFEAALGSQSGTMGGLFWSRIRLGKAVAGPGVRGQSATVGGLFWTRIRLGKAVAGPGVRG